MMLPCRFLPRLSLILLGFAPPGAHPAMAQQAPDPAPPLLKEDVDGLLKLADSLASRADFEAAEIAYFQLLKSPATPDHTLKTALLGLAGLYRKQGALTKAVAVFERYLKDHAQDERAPEALLELGRTLRQLGLHKTAISRFYSVLNSTLKVSGANFEHYQQLAKTAQFEIAQTHFEAGEFAEAYKFFTRLRLLDLAPADRARTHFMSAYAQRLQGNHDAAAASLRAFIEHSPADENAPEARYLLAITLRDLGRTEEALATTLDLLRTEQAKMSESPKRWSYWQRRTGNQLANDFFSQGDTFHALAIYRGLLALAPEPGWRLPLLYQIALCEERLGAIDRARQSHQQVVEHAGSENQPDLVELAQLSRWRLEHLGWREGIERQITSQLSPRPKAPAATAVSRSRLPAAQLTSP